MTAILDNMQRGGVGRVVVDKKAMQGEGVRRREKRDGARLANGTGSRDETPSNRLQAGYN